jgi:hypothetical protein
VDVPSETFAEFRWPRASRREIDGLMSLLLGFLADGWPE